VTDQISNRGPYETCLFSSDIPLVTACCQSRGQFREVGKGIGPQARDDSVDEEDNRHDRNQESPK
jgi:hypothetical protein